MLQYILISRSIIQPMLYRIIRAVTELIMWKKMIVRVRARFSILPPAIARYSLLMRWTHALQKQYFIAYCWMLLDLFFHYGIAFA